MAQLPTTPRSRASHQDANSILIGYDSFVNVPRLDGHDVKTVQKLYDAKDIDFRLKTGSPAIDRGIPLPNVTDGFAGRAPDLGAIEFGQAPPHGLAGDVVVLGEPDQFIR